MFCLTTLVIYISSLLSQINGVQLLGLILHVGKKDALIDFEVDAALLADQSQSKKVHQVK
jgi:hypothetical protein